jgi:hypothetical protein
MTRKLLALLFVPLFLFIFGSTANAVVNTTTESAQTSTAGNSQTTASTASKLRQQMQLVQEQKKAAVTQAKAMIQAKRDEFRTRIQEIKDQKKKVLIERIDARLAEVNKNQTARFTEVLNILQTFLDKINKSAIGTSIQASIATTQTTIDAARTAVEIQANKSYIMTISDDSALKVNAGTTVSQFRQDLTDVYKLVIDSKQALRKLNIDKELIRKEATNSAK